MPRMNHLSIIGHAGKDSEIKTFNGKRLWVCSMALDQGKDKEPTWIEVGKWENEKFPGSIDSLLAIKKGDAYFADGSLKTSTYAPANGPARVQIKCEAYNVAKLDWQKGESQKAPSAPTNASNDDLPF